MNANRIVVSEAKKKVILSVTLCHEDENKLSKNYEIVTEKQNAPDEKNFPRE
jgi:hypothetical protein